MLEDVLSRFNSDWRQSSTDHGRLPPITTFSRHETEEKKKRANSREASGRKPIVKKASSRMLLKSRQDLVPNNIRQSDVSRDGCFPCTHKTCPRALMENSFKRHYQLVEHLRIHTEERPFVCQICARRFLSKSNLDRHSLHHSGLRPYACPICQKAYYRSSDRSYCLKLHRIREVSSRLSRSSFKIKPTVSPNNIPISIAPCDMHADPPSAQQENKNSQLFACPVCSRKREYRDAGSLRRHVRSHHPDFKRPPAIQLSRKSSRTTSYSGSGVNSRSDLNVSESAKDAKTVLVHDEPEFDLDSCLLVDETSLVCTPSLPVDLCTSALCLAIGDSFRTKNISSEQTMMNALSRAESGSGPVPNSTQERDFTFYSRSLLDFDEVPLDLTENQASNLPSCAELFDFSLDSVIDLSNAPSCPVDLSNQPQNLSTECILSSDFSSIWEPEPGFSFTDLLANDDSMCREFIFGLPIDQEICSPSFTSVPQTMHTRAFELGLDLRLF